MKFSFFRNFSMVEPRHSRQNVLQRLEDSGDQSCQTLLQHIRKSPTKMPEMLRIVPIVIQLEPPSLLPNSEWNRALFVFALDQVQHLHKVVIGLHLQELHKITYYLETWQRMSKLPFFLRISQLATTPFVFSDALLRAHITKLQQLEASWIAQLGRLHIGWLEMNAIDSFHSDGHSITHFIASIYVLISAKTPPPIEGPVEALTILNEALNSMPEFTEWCLGRSKPLAPPSSFTRHLPLILFGTCVGVVAIRKIHMSRSIISDWVVTHVNGLRQFVLDHVVYPIVAIEQSIFNPIHSQNSDGALLASQSALEGMLYDYGKQIGIPDAKLRERSVQGDMTIVVDNFREEIQNPIRNAISGNLIQALLIQMQKAKLDGEEIAVRLEQILRANEVNFQFLALIPAIIAASLSASAMRRVSSSWFRTIWFRSSLDCRRRLVRSLKLLDFFLVTGLDPRHEDELSIMHVPPRSHRRGYEEDKQDREMHTGLLLLFLDELTPLAEAMGADRALLLADLRYLSSDAPIEKKHAVLQSMDRRYMWLRE